MDKQTKLNIKRCSYDISCTFNLDYVFIGYTGNSYSEKFSEIVEKHVRWRFFFVKLEAAGLQLYQRRNHLGCCQRNYLKFFRAFYQDQRKWLLSIFSATTTNKNILNAYFHYKFLLHFQMFQNHSKLPLYLHFFYARQAKKMRPFRWFLHLNNSDCYLFV